MGSLHMPATTVDVDAERALHYAVVKTASYAALVGQFQHHFPDTDVPAALREADSAAFDDATTLCEVAESETGNPTYDLTMVTRTAYESGKAHTDGECVFCDERAEVEELAVLAVSQAASTAAAVLA